MIIYCSELLTSVIYCLQVSVIGDILLLPYLHPHAALMLTAKIPNKILTATALKLVISSGYAVQRVLAHTKPNTSCGELIILSQ